MTDDDTALDEALLVLALAIGQGLQDGVVEAWMDASAALDRLALRDAVDAGDRPRVADLLRLGWMRGGAPTLARVLAEQLAPLVAAAAQAVGVVAQAPPETTGADARWLAWYLLQRASVLTASTLEGLEGAIPLVLRSALPTRLLVDELVALLGVRPRDWAGVIRLRDSLMQQGGPKRPARPRWCASARRTSNRGGRRSSPLRSRGRWCRPCSSASGPGRRNWAVPWSIG